MLEKSLLSLSMCLQILLCVSLLELNPAKILNQVQQTNKQQCSSNTNWLKELQCVCLSTLAVQNILQPVQQAQTGR